MDINDSQDLNIDDYNIDSLIELFELPKPINPEVVLSKLDGLVKKFSDLNNPEFVEFLEQARNKLLSSINPQQQIPSAFQDSDDETLASDVLDNEYWNNNKSENIPNRKDMTRIVTQQPYSILQRERLNIQQQKDIEFVQGQLNPDLKNTFIRLLNIDSHYREIVDISQNLCAPPDSPAAGVTNWKGLVRKNNLELDSPSNFTFDLSEPLSNVEEIQLNDVQIPRAWYVFDVAYGTNSFILRTLSAGLTPVVYTIPPGNYTGDQLATAIEESASCNGCTKFKNLGPTGGSASFDPVTNKITITLPSPGDSITFFTSSPPTYQNLAALDCDKSGLGGKRDYNLGWLMGFREKEYFSIDDGAGNSLPITGEALVDTFGTKYLYIVLDDFNKNRISYNLLGMTNNRDNFKLPSYYNRHTMATECKTENLVEAKTRPCRKGTPADKEFFPVDNLTKAQQYTANSIIQAQQSKSQDRYFSPNNPNILAKIPVSQAINYNSSAPLFGNLSIDHSMIFNNKRTYFGPVTIKRLNIQLVNDKGYNVNMNNMDWSMSLKIKQLYQY